MISTEPLRENSLGKYNIEMNINELVQSKVHVGNYFSNGKKTYQSVDTNL
jgi:hypothetical protein